MAGPRCSSAHARLRCDHLPRLGCRSVACRWCCGSSPCCHHSPPNSLSSCDSHNAEENFIEMDQGSGFEIPAVLLATRLWRILSKPESAQCHSRIRRESGTAPSHPQLSRGVSRLFAQIRRRVRRALCLGLKQKPRLIRAFSAGLWENNFSLGRCPGSDETAPLALNRSPAKFCRD